MSDNTTDIGIKCCFCGADLPEPYMRNSPFPVIDDDKSVCCTECHIKIVFPAKFPTES